MATLNDFLTLIAPHVEGCPQSTVVQAIRRAIRELCRESHLWRSTLADIDTVAGQSAYTLVPPIDTQIISVLHITHVDQDLSPNDEGSLDQCEYRWRSLNDARRATWYLHELYATDIRLVPAPLEADIGGLTNIRVALQPTLTATDVHDLILNDWDESIMYGALSRLMRFPEKQWTNLALAEDYRSRFDMDIGLARAKVLRGHTNQELKARPSALPGAP
jgi:hypothetical protein